jgi:hypothetical protein
MFVIEKAIRKPPSDIALQTLKRETKVATVVFVQCYCTLIGRMNLLMIA